MPRLFAIVLSVLALAAVFLFMGPPTPPPANAQFGDAYRCTRNSDCAGDLMCRAGRCMEQCQANRDCGPGQQCLMGVHQLHVCQLDQPSGPLPPDAAYCTSRRDCTSGACDSNQQCHGG